MYSYDPTEAFGSWCVKGAGLKEDTILKNNVRYRPVSLSEEEEIDGKWLSTIFSARELLIHLSAHDRDPRYQRIIQLAYEQKRRIG